MTRERVHTIKNENNQRITAMEWIDWLLGGRTLRVLDFVGFLVGVVYLVLEYRASVWLWLASIVMPAVDMVLYYQAGLYADFGMAIYYCLAALYGWAVWTRHRRAAAPGGEPPASAQASAPQPGRPITHLPRRLLLPLLLVTAALWAALWWLLAYRTDSTVPVADAFTTALSIVAMWVLARKHAEQWLLWLAVDAVCTVLYVRKGIPFKAIIYAIYTVVALLGYRKWLRLMHAQKDLPPRA